MEPAWGYNVTEEAETVNPPNEFPECAGTYLASCLTDEVLVDNPTDSPYEMTLNEELYT